MIKKNTVLAILITFCFTVALFRIMPINSSPGPRDYDPWYDINDDGTIDVKDIYKISMKYGTSGEPIDKTALLLDLQSRVEALEANYTEMSDNITSLEQRLSKVPKISVYPIEVHLNQLDTPIWETYWSCTFNTSEITNVYAIFAGEMGVLTYNDSDPHIISLYRLLLDDSIFAYDVPEMLNAQAVPTYNTALYNGGAFSGYRNDVDVGQHKLDIQGIMLDGNMSYIRGSLLIMQFG